jgi:hypothetical protein
MGLVSSGPQKKAGSRNYLPSIENVDLSDVWLRLAQPLDAVARLPLPALLQKVHALKALQDVPLHDNTAKSFEAFMLRHDVKFLD